MTTLLEEHTATLGLSNSHALRIKVIDSDTLQYQFIGETVGEIEEAEIIYEVNDLWADEEPDSSPAFKIDDETYFISDFLRDDYGRK